MDAGSVSSFLAHWPTDWIIIGALAVFIALDTIRSGSNRALSFALALPLTVFIRELMSNAFVLGNLLQQLTAPYAQTILFIVAFIIVYLLIHRMIGFYGSSSNGPFSALIVGIACAVLATIVWIQTPSLFSLLQPGSQVQGVFAEGYRFWWMAAAYLALAFARS